MKTIHILILIALLTSCNTPEGNTEKKGLKQADTNTSIINCYQYASTSDTINLKVIHVGPSITGTLVYNLREKDKNVGTIQGTMNGNVLLADYTFMSEGIQSIRQVAFKLEGNVFVEGYGDSFVKDGRVQFSNVSSLSFSPSIRLVETNCK